MKTTAEYLDAAKAKLLVSSDNQLANALEISRQAVSQYRSNVRAFDNFTCMKIAEVTGIPLDQIIFDMELQREPSEKRREAWENYMKRLGGVAAGFAVGVICIVTLAVTSAPLEASPALAFGPSGFVLC